LAPRRHDGPSCLLAAQRRLPCLAVSATAHDAAVPARAVAAGSRRFLGIWDHLKYLEEEEQVVDLRELRDGDDLEINAQDFVYAFLFDDGDRRLLVVMDEMDGWDPPPEAQGVDLAVLPKGIAEFNPFIGERQVPAEHPALQDEATFEETLEIVQKLNAHRVVMTHIEESDALSYDDLALLAERLRADGSNITFAFDTQIIDVS